MLNGSSEEWTASASFDPAPEVSTQADGLTKTEIKKQPIKRLCSASGAIVPSLNRPCDFEPPTCLSDSPE
jgi:hypothetical protein